MNNMSVSELARLGGLATRGISTKRKARAARANGRRGGRPRKDGQPPRKRRKRRVARNRAAVDPLRDPGDGLW